MGEIWSWHNVGSDKAKGKTFGANLKGFIFTIQSQRRAPTEAEVTVVAENVVKYLFEFGNKLILKWFMVESKAYSEDFQAATKGDVNARTKKIVQTIVGPEFVPSGLVMIYTRYKAEASEQGKAFEKNRGAINNIGASAELLCEYFNMHQLLKEWKTQLEVAVKSL